MIVQNGALGIEASSFVIITNVIPPAESPGLGAIQGGSDSSLLGYEAICCHRSNGRKVQFSSNVS